MTLRTRTLVSAAALVLAPLLVLGVAIRHETANRLRAQYAARVDSLIGVIETDLASRSRDLDSRIDEWKRTLRDDNRFRLALDGDENLRAYLLDAAGRAMTLMGLDVLQIQNRDGRILSSGHFRNDYDRVDREMIDWLRRAPRQLGLVSARRAAGAFPAIARLDSLRLGGSTHYVLGGWEIDRDELSALSPEPDLVVSFLSPEFSFSSDPEFSRRLTDPVTARATLRRLSDEGSHLVRELRLATADPGGASLVVSHSLSPMNGILRSLDLRLLLAWALVAAGSFALAARLSARFTQPIVELAEKTKSLDLDRLESDFATDRNDEIGTLSRFLHAMTGRLRSSVARLREAERRATLGEIARQVNHDLKNGFTPLRNVIRHLSEVATDSPGDLARVYGERRGTLESGIGYLEELATNYARLSARGELVACRIEEIVGLVTAGRLEADGGPIRLEIESGLPPVRADPVGLRRVVENLVANACESLEKGQVWISAARDRSDPGTICLRVRDEGRGIPEEDRERIFDHFYTTKDSGTGLGLSIVRRLVSDFDGSIDVKSERGVGSEFIVRLPATEEGS